MTLSIQVDPAGFAGDKAAESVRALIRRGAYGEAVAVGQELPAVLRGEPQVVLQIVRACMQQGEMGQAEANLGAVDLERATPGEALILALETAALRVFRYGDFQGALQGAARAFAQAAGSRLTPAEVAEAERVEVRIRLTAATYYELGTAEKSAALARLPRLAEVLTAAGWVDEALAARLTHAEQLATVEERLAALTAVALAVEAAQRPSLAAEALVNRANLLVGAGASSATIEAELERATTLYAQAGHVYGQHEVARTRARLAIEREHKAPTGWEETLAAYEALGYPRGVISVLLDLSQLAHHRGEMAAALRYRQLLVERAEAVGMGLLRDSEQTALVDLLMRNHKFGAAIETCQAALATNPPAFMAAGFEQLLATAYGFVQEYGNALDHLRRAVAVFERLGVTDSASDAVLLLASYLDSQRQDTAWAEAEALLQRWQISDERRGDFDAALNKSELRAQVCITRFVYSPTARGDQTLLHEAEVLLSAALPVAAQLRGIERVRREGALHQLRAQVYNLRNEMTAVIDAWRTALGIYQTGGLAMEAANSQYILGALHLNLANQELQPNFGEAESNLLAALAYYTAAYMRGQAADTRFMVARLYTNASLAIANPVREQLLEAALAQLTAAEADYDAIRREYAVGTVVEAQRGKRTLIAKSQRIYSLALEIVTMHKRDEIAAWRWTQQAKARALTDALGAGAVTPARVLAGLAGQPAALALVQEEQALAAAIEQAAPAELPGRRAALEAHYAQMQQEPLLADYLELRHGVALAPEDLAALATGTGEGDETCVFIDWVAVEDRIFFLALRPGETPYIERLALSVSAVQRFVSDNLNERAFRLTLRDQPAQMRAMDGLIAPIGLVAKPDELLVLAPSGPVYALPLHALELGGTPLIARNPVVYTPSLSVLRHCMARGNSAHALRSAALFGDPVEDTASAAGLVQQLAAYLGERQIPTVTFVGTEVTRGAFERASPGQDLVYFHGHAVHETAEPLASHLQMADGAFSAQAVFGLRDLNAEMVILAACQSAASVIATGDEPLGLIPAFLYAGSRAVLASQWRIQRGAAARWMQHFLEALLGLMAEPLGGDAVEASRGEAGQGEGHLRLRLNKARAVQQAALALRSEAQFAAPYFWAPFVLYGDWR